jgi:competence protein ComEC
LLAQYPGGLDPVYGLALLALALCAGICSYVVRREHVQAAIALLLACALLGGGMALLRHPPPTAHDLAYYNAPATDTEDPAPPVTLAGVITAEPTFGDRSQTLRISAATILLKDSDRPIPISGDLLAVVPRYPEYSFGERLSLVGKLTDPPRFDAFDYAAYLAHLGVYSYLSFPKATSFGRSDDNWLAGLVVSARNSARNALQRAIAEPQASLAVGVVLGDRSSMPPDLKDDFKNTGTTHILAISGQNISLLVGLVWLAVGGRESKRRMPLWLTLLTITMLAIYTAFTGATPSVMRAAVMGAILLCAPLVGRRYDPLAALSVSAACMILLDPYVLADAGFQLSYLAMLGITVLAPYLYALSKRLRLPAVLGLPIATALSAQAGTLPLGILLTRQFALVSPIATLTADISLLPLMVAGISTALVGLVPIMAPLGFVTGAAAWLSASWLLWWVHLWAAMPFASISVGGFLPLYALVYYALFFPAIWVAADPHRRRSLVANWPRIRVPALGFTAVGVWAIAIALYVLS